MCSLDKAATDLWQLTSTIGKLVAGAVFVHWSEYPRAHSERGDAGSGGLEGDHQSHAAHVQKLSPLLPTYTWPEVLAGMV